MDDQFLSADEAAAELDVSVEELAKLVAAGELQEHVPQPGAEATYWRPQVLALAARNAAGLTLDALKTMSPQQVAAVPPAKLARALAGKPKASPPVAPKAPAANAGAMQ